MTLISWPGANRPVTALARVSMVHAGAFCTRMSPLVPFRKANSTKSTASSRDIMNRVMFGSVMVMGLPALIWSIHSGMTLPREHMTFP